MIQQVYAYDISNPTPFENFGGLLTTLVPNIFILAGLLTFFYLIFGGFKYMTAGGDEKAVTSAKNMITNAAVGLIIIFCAWWIMHIIEIVIGVSIFGTP